MKKTRRIEVVRYRRQVTVTRQSTSKPEEHFPDIPVVNDICCEPEENFRKRADDVDVPVSSTSPRLALTLLRLLKLRR